MRGLLFALFLGLVLFSPLPSQAQLGNPSLIPASGILAPDCNFVTGEFHFHCIPLYVSYLIKLVFSFLGTIALIQIMIAGYQIQMGHLTGDNEGGKKRLYAAIFGLVFSLLAFLLIDTVISAVIP